MGPTVVRSSLELMLDAIRQRDERTEGAPPALPSRPTCRGRLPSMRRPLLPVQLKDGAGLDNEREERKGVVGKYGLSRVGAEPFSATMPELECCEEGSLPEGAESPLNENLGWGAGAAAAENRVLNKIALDEDSRYQTMEGILRAQKRIHGHQAPHDFQDLKRGAITLQSFVRGERARDEFEYREKRLKAVILIQKHVKRWSTRKTFDGRRNDVIVLQSVVRGYLARKQFILLKNLKVSELCQVEVNRDQGKNLQEMQDSRNQNPEVCPLVLTELQRRVLQAEAALRIKEEENVMLQEQVHQYETRWSDYEARMKSMEVVWQKKLTSLQMSLEAAKKSLVADDMEGRLERPDVSPEHHYLDTMSVDTHTTECTPTKQNHATGVPQRTPPKQARSSDPKLPRNSNAPRNAVSNLVKEFEQRRQAFENKAAFLVEPNSGNLDPLMDPYEELQKLKVRVSDWQKDYKVRLQETTLALQKYRNPGTGKAPRKWWAIGCAR